METIFTPTIIIILVIFGVVIGLGTILKEISKKNKGPGKSENKYHYKRKTYLLTQNEKDFYKTLEEVIDNKYYIFPQVHISSIVYPNVKGKNYYAALNHVNRKSVDYVLCEKKDLSPIAAIELDDPTHAEEDRIVRDHEVERIFSEINLPLIRINSSEKFNKDLVRLELTKIEISNI